MCHVVRLHTLRCQRATTRLAAGVTPFLRFHIQKITTRPSNLIGGACGAVPTYYVLYRSAYVCAQITVVSQSHWSASRTVVIKVTLSMWKAQETAVTVTAVSRCVLQHVRNDRCWDSHMTTPYVQYEQRLCYACASPAEHPSDARSRTCYMASPYVHFGQECVCTLECCSV